MINNYVDEHKLPEPGDNEVLMYGATVRPNLTAFLARIPAPNITLGLEVFVHDVTAEITTEPCFRVYCLPSSQVKLPADFNESPAISNPLKPI